MTVWSPVEDECRVVAVWNWSGEGEYHLSLELGRVLLVRAHTDYWYYGELVADDVGAGEGELEDHLQRGPVHVGIFPKSCVRVVSREPADEDSAGALCDDIARALRAWRAPWRALYVSSGAGAGGAQFKFVEVSVRALLKLRSEAAAGPPMDALRRLRRTAVFSMDRGDRALGRPLAVRDDLLRPVGPLTVRAAELLALHEQTESRVIRNKEPAPGAVRPAGSHCVLLRVSHVVCRATGGAAGDRTELRLALHRGERALTESVCVRCPARGVVTAIAVFCELSADELRERVHLVCHVVRVGDMEPRPASVSGGGGAASGGRASGELLRRPCGLAVLDVTRHLAPSTAPAPPHLEDDKEIFLPFYPCEKESMESLLKKVLSGRAAAETGSGVWGAIRREAGDVRDVCARSPLLSAPKVARRLALSDLAAPSDARNDLYVRLVGGSFAGQRNVEVTARVWGPAGPVAGALCGADSYSSLVYYHEERPRWQELFAVRLSPDEFRGASLVLELRHRGSSPARDRIFALSYLRLVQQDGTATRDDDHALAVYRYEPRRSPRDLVTALLAMPSRRTDPLPAADHASPPLTLLPKDVLLVATQLCSTKLTYREEILGVLKWRSASDERQVCASLRALLDAPDREVVKFLQDVLDAVFDILTETYRPDRAEQLDDDDELCDAAGPLALSCILRVTGLVSEHQFAQFRAPLDSYVQAGFCNPLAAGPLLRLAAVRVERGLRARADDERAGRRLLRLARGLPYLLRFAARSRDLRAELAARDRRDPPDAPRDDHDALAAEQLLSRLADVMSRADSGALLVQGSVLKYLPQCAPALLRLLPASRVSSALVTLLSRLPAARLPTQRAHALLELARGPLLSGPDPRRVLLPHVAATLRTFLLRRLETEERGEDAAARRSADKLARVLGAELAGDTGAERGGAADGSGGQAVSLWRAQVDVCAGVVADLVALLPPRGEGQHPDENRAVGDAESDRELLCRELLPPLVRIALGKEPGEGEGRRRNGDERDSSSGEEEVEMAGEGGTSGGPGEEGSRRRLVAALLDLLLACGPRELRGVLSASPGRTQRERPARELVRVCRVLWSRPCFPPHWAAMLRLQAHALLNGLRALVPVIAQEFPPRVSPRLWRDWYCAVTSTADGAPPALARRTAARLARDTWTSLPASQRAVLLPEVVGPHLSLSLLPDPAVRAVSMPLFHDMMLLELREDPAGRIDKVENELIEQLDEAVSGGAGDAAWRAEFVSVVGGLCAGEGGAGKAGLALVAAAGRQVDALLGLRGARGAGEQRAGLAGLLRLYGELERPALRARCLARLAELHLAASAPAPAGLALRARAELLPPGEDRERLQRRAACLLAQGKLWEAAAELRTRLLSGLRDYGALAEEHAALAELYGQARSCPRAPPAYYRVVHRGRLAPATLRAPLSPLGLVHAGGECELLSEFSARVLHEWPGAELLHTLDDRPDLDLIESHFLQINAVEPVSGREDECDDRVPDELRLHLLHHDVAVFRYSRPVRPPACCADDADPVNEFATRWLERTELHAAESLPAPLGWSCVLRATTRLVSPLEVALETMRDANSQLRALVLRLRARPELPLAPLTMRLAGVLDAAVMGGVEQYERAFLDEDAPPPAAPPGDRHLVAGRLDELRELIACQVPLLQAALQLQAALAPPALADLHEHLRRRLQLHAARVHRRYGRRACTLPEYRPPQPEPARPDSEPAPPPAAPPSKNLFTSLARYSGGPAQFSTMQHGGKRRDKRRPRRSEVVSAGPAASSQWYTGGAGSEGAGATGGSQRGSSSSASLADLLNNNNTENTADLDTDTAGAATSPLRELTQELSASRPLRAEAEREVRGRRLSQRPLSIQSTCSTVAGNRNSAGTTDSTPSEEEQPAPPPPPPPLPHKTRCEHPSPATAPAPARYSYDTVLSPRGSFLYTSLQQRRAAPGASTPPPTPPPKKKHNK